MIYKSNKEELLDTLRATIKYLEHPEVERIPFALRPDGVIGSLKRLVSNIEREEIKV